MDKRPVKPELMLLDELETRLKDVMTQALVDGLKAPIISLALVKAKSNLEELSKTQTIEEIKQYLNAQKEEKQKSIIDKGEDEA